MINNPIIPRPTLKLLSKVGTAWLAAMLLFAVPVAGFAQEITGSVRGKVTTPTGQPAAGTTITVTDTRTGSRRTVTASESGSFNVRGLTVGGPYTIAIASGEYKDALITDVFTKLSGATTYNIALEEAAGEIEEIIVTASREVIGAELAIGPSTAFNLAEIQALPTINRQIRDVIRLDPRVGIGRASGGNGFQISCSGGSNRSNSFTIDGVRSADGFGLNASGNSARNTFPIPFDTVRSASVEFAPMDVQYGQFTGCNVNVVTKSGSNDFQGSAFYLFSDQNLLGDKLDGNDVVSEPFEDKTFGFEFSGPIIKDKLFFYTSYEETNEGGAQNAGPIGAGFQNEGDLTIEDANTIAGILGSQYDRDPGFLVRNLPRSSERIFARIDWNINENHRFEATYVDLEELNLEPDDFGFGGFTFSDNFEVEGTKSDAISGRLFSNWTDRFSTELRYSSLDVTDLQGPLGGGEAQDATPIPRIQVEDGSGNVILTSGPGFFRSANDLQYTLDQFKLAGDYVIGDHTLTVGYELDSLEVFNLFVANGTGTITFASIADLQAGLAGTNNSRTTPIVGDGSFTGDINDAAASFKRNINTFYLQDEWQASDRLIITAGLRYDSYDSSDRPIENPVFIDRYGFSNATGFDGLDIFLPRLGLTYDLPYNSMGDMQLRAGFGVFTGGDPTVHFSNAFSNFGGGIGRGRSSGTGCTAADLQVLDGSGNFTGIPDCIVQQQITDATQNTARTHAVDPGFDLPSTQRWNIGLNIRTDSSIDILNEWDVQLDYIYGNHKNSAEFLDLTLSQAVDDAGNPIFLPDGRAQMMPINTLNDGCDAVFIAPGQGFSNVTTACDGGRRDEDILMTNGPSGNTKTFSLKLGKAFNYGEDTSLDVNFGYAFTDAGLGNPVGSSTATSSFEEVATPQINRNVIGPSPYQNEHNFVLSATWKHYFFADNPTTIGLFFRRRSGRPFSYTYDSRGEQATFGDSDDEERNLLYVPTGLNDPLVDFSAMSVIEQTAFFDFLDRTGLNKYAGRISPKNGFNQDWTSDLDLRLQQDIPLPGANHSLKLFFDIENVLNLFNNNWNIQRFADTGNIFEAVPVLRADFDSDNNRYVYSNFNPGRRDSSGNNFRPTNVDTDDSLWRVQVGVKYMFGGSR